MLKFTLECLTLDLFFSFLTCNRISILASWIGGFRPTKGGGPRPHTTRMYSLCVKSNPPHQIFLKILIKSQVTYGLPTAKPLTDHIVWIYIHNPFQIASFSQSNGNLSTTNNTQLITLVVAVIIINHV
jgi:hypothetical protein